jgi:TetR/AcrR family transcriptional repressor of nem operon
MRKGEQTRQMILQRASVIFNQHGYKASSISEVMKATRLEKGGIYRHFDSKDELSIEAFDYMAKLMYQRYKQALSGKQGLMERLNAVIEVFENLMNENPFPGGCPIINAALEADDSYPTLLEHSRTAMDRLREIVTRIIQEGIQEEELVQEINSRELGDFWISSLEGALALSMLYGDKKYIQAAARHLLAYTQTKRLK